MAQRIHPRSIAQNLPRLLADRQLRARPSLHRPLMASRSPFRVLVGINASCRSRRRDFAHSFPAFLPYFAVI